MPVENKMTHAHVSIFIFEVWLLSFSRMLECKDNKGKDNSKPSTEQPKGG